MLKAGRHTKVVQTLLKVFLTNPTALIDVLDGQSHAFVLPD